LAGENRLDGTLPAGIAQMASLQELYAFCAITCLLWYVLSLIVGCRNVTFNLLEGDVTTIARMNMAYLRPRVPSLSNAQLGTHFFVMQPCP
jgi:hypothetical protein